MAELFAAGLGQILHLINGGVTQQILHIVQALGVLLADRDHGGDNLIVTPDLALHLGFAVHHPDDGAQAQQLARKGGSRRDAATLFHLLEAVRSNDDLGPVHLVVELIQHMAQLGAVLELAGHLAEVPAEHHGVGVAVHQMDLHLVFGALFPQHILGHNGVAVGGAAGTVEGNVDHIGITCVHILTVFLAELDGGQGCGGGHALGFPHQVVELLVGAAHPLQVVHTVQSDVDAHNINAILVGQLLRDVAGGVGQDCNFAHNVPHFHS